MPKNAGDRRGLVVVARVVKAHGIRGEICMDSHADSPQLFAQGTTLYLARGECGRPAPYVVRGLRAAGCRLLVSFEGVSDRDAAESLRGAEVLVPESVLPPPDEGEVYLHQLIGARVVLADGAEVGVFEAILETPGQLTWVIRGKGGAEILFPAVPAFILDIDAGAGLVRIDPPPGLLDLYLSLTPPRPAQE